MSKEAKLELDGKVWNCPSSWAPKGSGPSTSRQLRDQTGYITSDDGYGNTGSCQSQITFIDGEKGILRYRGIPIEELAERSTFIETAYLIIFGHLPTAGRAAAFLRPADQRTR